MTTTYEVDSNGIIFQIDQPDNAPTHRTPYPPGSTLPTSAAPELIALTQQVWTDEVVAAYQVIANRGPLDT